MDKSKDEFRKEIIRRLRSQDPSYREERSRIIQEKLLSIDDFRGAGTVVAYISMPTEVSTEYLIKKALEQGKRVAVPYIEPQKAEMTVVSIDSIECLEKGPFGTYQPDKKLSKPMQLKEIDLIVVPGIAFDKNNMRLGRGKGYFDRFLSSVELSSTKTVGLAFCFQIVDSLPFEPHDRPVSRVITD